jgi:hypothetical protein
MFWGGGWGGVIKRELGGWGCIFASRANSEIVSAGVIQTVTTTV